MIYSRRLGLYVRLAKIRRFMALMIIMLMMTRECMIGYADEIGFDPGIMNSGNIEQGNGVAAAADIGVPEAGITDPGNSDTVVPESGIADPGNSDMGNIDTVVPESGIADPGKSDTGKSDTGNTDTVVPESGIIDPENSDTGNSDTAVPERGIENPGNSDAENTDTVVPESGITDPENTYSAENGNKAETVEKGNSTDPVENGNNTDPDENENNTDSIEKGNNTDPVENVNNTDSVENGNNTDPDENVNNTDSVENGNNTDSVGNGDNTTDSVENGNNTDSDENENKAAPVNIGDITDPAGNGNEVSPALNSGTDNSGQMDTNGQGLQSASKFTGAYLFRSFGAGRTASNQDSALSNDSGSVDDPGKTSNQDSALSNDSGSVDNPGKKAALLSSPSSSSASDSYSDTNKIPQSDVIILKNELYTYREKQNQTDSTDSDNKLQLTLVFSTDASVRANRTALAKWIRTVSGNNSSRNSGNDSENEDLKLHYQSSPSTGSVVYSLSIPANESFSLEGVPACINVRIDEAVVKNPGEYSMKRRINTITAFADQNQSESQTADQSADQNQSGSQTADQSADQNQSGSQTTDQGSQESSGIKRTTVSFTQTEDVTDKIVLICEGNKSAAASSSASSGADALSRLQNASASSDDDAAFDYTVSSGDGSSFSVRVNGEDKPAQGTISFALKAGQTAVISELMQGVVYHISQKAGADWTAASAELLNEPKGTELTQLKTDEKGTGNYADVLYKSLNGGSSGSSSASSAAGGNMLSGTGSLSSDMNISPYILFSNSPKKETVENDQDDDLTDEDDPDQPDPNEKNDGPDDPDRDNRYDPPEKETKGGEEMEKIPEETEPGKASEREDDPEPGQNPEREEKTEEAVDSEQTERQERAAVLISQDTEKPNEPDGKEEGSGPQNTVIILQAQERAESAPRSETKTTYTRADGPDQGTEYPYPEDEGGYIFCEAAQTSDETPVGLLLFWMLLSVSLFLLSAGILIYRKRN